jgi:tetratricopeptide (TPR) repeat protein
MKKFFLLIAAVSLTIGVVAQKGKVTSALSYIDQNQYDKAKEAIDQALTNEKSMNWFNTYFAKGKLCEAIFKSDDVKYASYYADPLAEAYTSYEKSIQLDPKGSVKKRIITNMVYNSLAQNLYIQGGKRFEQKDFEGALKSFTTQIEITESDKYVGGVDTGMYYNAGLAAVNAKKFNEAIKYFEKCAEMKYLGITPYYQIYESILGIGDTTKAEAYLLDLPKKFPEDNTITLQIIDLYLKSSKFDEALIYIAKKDDPNNFSLYLAAGSVYLQQNRNDEAIPELQKTVELKPDFYESQYGLGAAYINKAADMFVKANEIMDVKKYSAAIDEANLVYAKALPYMENALELKPDDIYTMRSLQELYYRMKQNDPQYGPKYEAIKAKIATMEQK